MNTEGMSPDGTKLNHSKQSEKMGENCEENELQTERYDTVAEGLDLNHPPTDNTMMPYTEQLPQRSRTMYMVSEKLKKRRKGGSSFGPRKHMFTST